MPSVRVGSFQDMTFLTGLVTDTLVACAKCRKVFHRDLVRIPFTSLQRKTCPYCRAAAEIVQPSLEELDAYHLTQRRMALIWISGEVLLFAVVALWVFYRA